MLIHTAVGLCADVLKNLQSTASLCSFKHIKVDQLIVANFNLIISSLGNVSILLKHSLVTLLSVINIKVRMQELAPVSICTEPNIMIMELFTSFRLEVLGHMSFFG